MIETEAEARDKKSARKHGIEPRVILAQCLAALDKTKTVAIAREIVRTKIGAQARAVASPETLGALRAWFDRLEDAQNLSSILMIEAHSAAAYWREFRHMGLRETRGGNLPRSWLRHPMRNRGSPAFYAAIGKPVKGSPQNASHPINAMLNYAYVVEAGRLARALAARGLALQIGFLHKAKRGRNSLVWDAIEILRPSIDASVFAFVAKHEFGRADFPQAGLNVYRLSRELTQLLLHSVLLPAREIEAAADWTTSLILSGGRQREARRDKSARAKSSLAPPAVEQGERAGRPWRRSATIAAPNPPKAIGRVR
jgi:CRISPR-associated protein Cas1